MKEYAVSYTPCQEVGTVIYVSVNETFLGAIVIADTVKEPMFTRSNHFNYKKL